MGENCFNCPEDCGVCSYCGDGKCETDETCANCPQDCGPCKVETCIGTVTCAIGCLMPLDLACLQTCLAGACANAINAANNVITCAEMNCLGVGGGGGILGCLSMACPNQLASCVDTSCTEM
jgi:hypothetical protein